MKISSSCSRFSKRPFALYAGVALTFKFFGPVPDLLKQHNPWSGLRDEAPVLVVLRAQKAELAATPPTNCADWVEALKKDQLGQPISGLSEQEWSQAVKSWGPWKRDDIEAIDQCEKLPCKVKLNAAETAQMAAVLPTYRQKRFFELIRARAQNYLKSEARTEYEFAGAPVDPWKRLEELGLRSPLAMPPQPKLTLRRIDFFPGKLQTIHQVLDHRLAVAQDRRRATLWRRDVYTDHYFDSWGEWADVNCGGDGSVTVTQGLLVELDLMKKTDLVSKFMRSNMRDAVDDNGERYLSQGFERLKLRASKAESPAAAATGSSR